MNHLHPGAKWLFRLRVYSQLFVIGIFLIIWLFQLLNLITGNATGASLVIAMMFYILFMGGIGELYAQMSYSRWLYEIGQDGVKIEHGIIWKKYTSLPYERVQNVDIRRGIIARMFGFSSLEIETAGQSGPVNYGLRLKGSNKQYHSEGYLPAIEVNEAEKIRDFVMKKIKQTNRRKQGL